MSLPLAIVTTGPASAPIDDVRRITNFSTGEIGVLLAAKLVKRGFEVLLFCGKGATFSSTVRGVKVQEFSTNDDLTYLLSKVSARRGNEVGAIFHAAALSDYEVIASSGSDGAATTKRKIPGNLSRLHLTLVPAAKVLPKLRPWFSHAQITSWKYEIDGSKSEAVREAQRHISSGQSDVSVVNGAAYGEGFGVLVGEDLPLHFTTKRKLADFLTREAAKFVKRHK